MTELLMSKQDKKILERILSKYSYNFYAYGSRVKGTARKYSDLDLCYQEEIPCYKVVEIEEELENSDLPFVVELVNWKHMRPAFQKAIQKDLMLISASGSFLPVLSQTYSTIKKNSKKVI